MEAGNKGGLLGGEEKTENISTIEDKGGGWG
jgi:hypothetical protein